MSFIGRFPCCRPPGQDPIPVSIGRTVKCGRQTAKWPKPRGRAPVHKFDAPGRRQFPAPSDSCSPGRGDRCRPRLRRVSVAAIPRRTRLRVRAILAPHAPQPRAQYMRARTLPLTEIAVWISCPLECRWLNRFACGFRETRLDSPELVTNASGAVVVRLSFGAAGALPDGSASLVLVVGFDMDDDIRQALVLPTQPCLQVSSDGMPLLDRDHRIHEDAHVHVDDGACPP